MMGPVDRLVEWIRVRVFVSFAEWELTCEPAPIPVPVRPWFTGIAGRRKP